MATKKTTAPAKKTATKAPVKAAKKVATKPVAKEVKKAAPKAEKSVKVPATKATPKVEKTEGSKRMDRNLKITVLVEGNPKRAGSQAALLFGLYKSEMTVGEYLAAGGTGAALTYDVKHGYISVK